ncbi:MAG TPA: XylR family transcriptional regulator [Phycisphaerae bacterium]|jgi:LacI family transcriptional regulator|nr:XylR family transcriptional regulator [Phycisphaerae bacterium]HOB76171.1 XylR family transcriptional regulator [Phycisphaerae bacterium]HPU34509.1 XylR family transcriptional regulator [Phycisphaerae bacterium]HQA43795.1 XylR family transcriptional regulator [Phycisphaerae bacterium]HQE44034.1 XylR family transcriptional regulator [Phycisphaerae bacterium]
MAKRPRVALIIESSTIFGRDVLHGVARYVRSHQPWSIFLEQREFGAMPPAWLLRRRWDGIISRPTDKRLADAFRRMKTPVVDLNSMHSDLGLPRIRSDNRAIGRLGAEHLLERGFRHFAFCGYSAEWSDLRREGFMAAVEGPRHTCHVYESPWRGRHMPEWDEDQERIAKWIQSLPKPCGLMACNDPRGQQVVDACWRVDVAVPELVAVIGVDNDEILCEMCDPPLSSVVPNPRRIGYEAAALLDRLMAGKSQPDFDCLNIEPVGVKTRQSSDVLAVEDSDIAAAMTYIRDHATEGCTVEDVLRHVPMGRSCLERRFRKFLGRSPQAEINRVRIKRIKQLLAETDLPLSRIAELVGYQHPEYMNVVFKRETGQTPGQYRREVQLGGTPSQTGNHNDR